MKRREFLKTSLTASALAGASLSMSGPAAEPAPTPGREFYELRRYHLRRGPKQKLFDDFFRDAAIPAMNRAGLAPIGVFNVMVGSDSPTAYVLIPYRSGEAFVSGGVRVFADAEFQKAGAGFLDAPAGDPAYVRVASSFLRAFSGMPKLEVPEAIRNRGSRVFELRVYESHSKKANQKKIEMFDLGEIAIFRRAGLHPVFFGEALIGDKLPNLTYLLGYANLEARDQAWRAFGSDPEWKKLSTTPGYTDAEIVSNISNTLLRPAAYSQI